MRYAIYDVSEKRNCRIEHTPPKKNNIFGFYLFVRTCANGSLTSDGRRIGRDILCETRYIFFCFGIFCGCVPLFSVGGPIEVDLAAYTGQQVSRYIYNFFQEIG